VDTFEWQTVLTWFHELPWWLTWGVAVVAVVGVVGVIAEQHELSSEEKVRRRDNALRGVGLMLIAVGGIVGTLLYWRSDIRSADFRNRTYDLAGTACAKVLGRNTVTVKDNPRGNPHGNRGFRPTSLYYGDLTGDGREDAVLLVACGGGETPTEQPFVYTMHDGTLERIAVFEAGRRAHGGLVRGRECTECAGGVLIHDGDMYMARTYGTKVCCPEYIEIRRYRWDGNRFELIAGPDRKPFKKRR
jgi:hypothetical protein